MDVAAYKVIVKEINEPVGPATEVVPNTGLHAVQSSEITEADVIESGGASFSEATADPVQEDVQFASELTTQEAVEYDTVTTDPDIISPANPDPVSNSYPSQLGESDGTGYTMAVDSLQTGEQPKGQHSSYNTEASENVENLMQLSDSSQMNLPVENPNDIETSVNS